MPVDNMPYASRALHAAVWADAQARTCTDCRLWRERADRYFGSFPKVGIVIPNPSTWLLPEFQDLASALERTLMLPPNGQLSNGVSLQPDSDGFLIFLPSGACPRQHLLCLSTQD